MFKAATDKGYIRFLNRLHSRVLFDWYLEVGCRQGNSLAKVRGKSIGVDPFFRIEKNVVGQKPSFMAFQQTSDAFFESGVLERMGVRLSMSFLDGMHLMEFLLRDMMNAERMAAEGGVIAMHDCCPYTSKMTTRDVPRRGGAWTGDVWKLIPILQHYRPDLDITVLGCRPTGLVLVSNLDPRNTILEDAYEEILAEWQSVELETYGVARFFESFEYTPVQEIEDSGYALFSKVRLAEKTQATPEFTSP